LAPAEALALNAEAAQEVQALVLDGNDNFLIGALRQGGSAFQNRGPLWQRVVSVYLAHLEALLRAALVPSMSNSLPPVRMELVPFDTVS